MDEDVRGPEGAPAPGPLLGIGAFAARARLSAKALRLYDRLGLLTPAHVDAVTGYRRYHEDQIERARLVALLRRLDMPLAQIAGIVEAEGARGAGLLDAYWSEAESRHAERRALVGHLRRRLNRTTGRSQDMADLYAEFDVELVEIPAQWLITETRHVLADELPV